MVRIVKKAEERRREIIEASRELFLRQEYEKTTIQDVMAKVQIAKGTAYHYFRSKEELLEAVVEEMAREYIAEVEKALRDSHGDALERMRALVAAGRVASRQQEVVENLHRPGNINLHVRLLAVLIARLAPLYVEVIQQGCEEGIFSVKNPLECAEVLLAGIQFVTDVGCYPWNAADLERRVRALPAIVESLLQAPDGSFSFLNNIN